MADLLRDVILLLFWKITHPFFSFIKFPPVIVLTQLFTEKVPEIRVETTPSLKSEEGALSISSEPSDFARDSKVPTCPMIDSTALIKGKPIGDVIKSMQKFQGKMPKGNIDVWWLVDDGGLTLLIPHLISMKSNWEKCRLRVFATGKKEEINREKMSMANMLSKFRIDFSDLEIIPDFDKKPKKENLQRFDDLIKPWQLNVEAGETAEKFPWKITQDEIKLLREKVWLFWIWGNPTPQKKINK